MGKNELSSIQQLIDHFQSRMPDPSTARLDIEILIAQVLEKNRTWLRTFADCILSSEQLSLVNRVLERRVLGEPVAHILGEWEFYSLRLKVTPATLVPRPETELLVERALTLCDNFQQPRVLDLGTGTGAIAIALKKYLPDASVVAVDLSEQALEVAKHNAKEHRCDIEFYCGSWFSALSNQQIPFDIILSNPPYVAENDPHLVSGDLPFEPRMALTAGADEFSDLVHIISESKHYFSNKGYLLVEHGYDQGSAVRTMYKDNDFQNIRTHKDYGQCERFTEGYYS